GDSARDERRGCRLVDDGSFTKERLCHGRVLVLAKQALQRLRRLEEQVGRGSGRSRQFGGVTRPFERDPQLVQLAVLQVRAEALGRVRERAKLATRDSLEWDRLHACAKARRKMEPRKEVLVRLLVQRVQQPPLGFVAK